MTHEATIIDDWQQSLKHHCNENALDNPNFYVSDPSSLLTTCTTLSFSLGTGESILSQALERCRSAEQEVLLVTCFWARSASQELVAELLRDLSAKAVRKKSTIRVCICFSSLSATQKLFHTASPEGQVWPPSSWSSKFGLPSQQEIPGVDLQIKSIFFLPFSVMHPKFIVVDRKLAFLPSCNVSWEKWFEGCVEFEGELVEKLVKFFGEFWMPLPHLAAPVGVSSSTEELIHGRRSCRGTIFSTPIESGQITTLFLPSPHHRDPKFRPFPLSSCPPPPTPLNTLLLTLIRAAKHDIYIQTPNLTAAPVITALLEATRVGINIHIVTSSKLMVLEQLGTSGTTTELSVRTMMRRYRALQSRINAKKHDDEEALRYHQPLGNLKVEWYKPQGTGEDEPVKSHLKLCVVDTEVTVLGSGNLDRASWYTSQELGVAFLSRDLAEVVREGVRRSLSGRLE